MTRYVLEGTWTGYVSRQRQVAHREVIDDRRCGKGFIEKLRNLNCVVYTDGTSLLVSIREAKPRERVVTLLGYSTLIREAVAHGGSRVLVADLHKHNA